MSHSTISDFTNKVIKWIQRVPHGKVSTYGNIALLAEKPSAARSIARILRTYSHQYKLPWHRILNYKGRIVIKEPILANIQRELLLSEGIIVSNKGEVDLFLYMWNIEKFS